MKVVRLDAAAVDRDGFFDHRAGWHFHGRHALCEWHAAAGHQRDAQLTRLVVHALGPIPAIREMLVVENGDEPLTAAHRGDDLVPKLLPRIHPLAKFVRRILAVLADEEHAIDGERLAAQAKSLV